MVVAGVPAGGMASQALLCRVLLCLQTAHVISLHGNEN